MRLRSLLLAVPLWLAATLPLGACAEDDDPPPVHPLCGFADSPADCPCERTGDCWIDHCCLPSLSGAPNRCVAYKTLANPVCLPQ